MKSFRKEIISSLGKVFSFHHPIIPPPIYKSPMCVRYRGAARAALARHEEEPVGADWIGFLQPLQFLHPEVLLWSPLLHAFICQIYRICFYLCLIRLNLNVLYAFHLDILCIGKVYFSSSSPLFKSMKWGSIWQNILSESALVNFSDLLCPIEK